MNKRNANRSDFKNSGSWFLSYYASTLQHLIIRTVFLPILLTPQPMINTVNLIDSSGMVAPYFQLLSLGDGESCARNVCPCWILVYIIQTIVASKRIPVGLYSNSLISKVIFFSSAKDGGNLQEFCVA